MDAARAERAERVADLLEQALALTARERVPFLDRIRAEDATLIAEVESLLTAYEAAPNSLDGLAARILPGMIEEVSRALVAEAPIEEQTVGQYRILSSIGNGGMGAVYKARDLELDRLVALKFLAPYLTADVEARARLRAEARAASALDHANIATVYEIGSMKPSAEGHRAGSLFIAMAYYAGETVRAKIARGPLPIAEAVDYARQAADGLAAAHEAGIVHRDVKPANLIVTERGVVKILDFGVAKQADAGVTREGGSAVMPGTVPYMSPEQTRGEEQLGPPTDIWSLGVLLYEMLAGRRPFVASTPDAVIDAIRNDEPERLLRLRPDVPRAIARVVDCCLQKDPQARYRDAAALAKELRQDLVDTNPDRRVAVLPFDYFSSDQSQQYLADGTTEELIGRLSKLSGVRVIARTSVMAYRDSEKDTARIGKELGVGTLIDGSVRRAGDRVRIAIVMIDVETQEALWADELEAEATELLDLQIGLAERAAVALGVRMRADERRQLARRGTEDAAAYDAYLRGRYLLAGSDVRELPEARRHFERAVARDSSFAGAWSGVADAYYPGGHVILFPTDAEYRQSRRAAERALELDPESAEAHTSLAVVLTYYYWDSEGAERHFQRAIELDPSYARAHATYAEHLGYMGRFGEARIRARTAAELDPNAYLSQIELAIVAYMEGRYDETVVRARDLARRGPEYASAWFFVGLASVQLRRFDEALAALDAADPDHVMPHPLAIRGHVHALMGNHEAARRIWAAFDERAPGARGFNFDRAVIHMGLGECQRVLDLLDHAVERRDWRVRLLGVEPVFDSLRSEPRFSRILERAGLVPQLGLVRK